MLPVYNKNYIKEEIKKHTCYLENNTVKKYKAEEHETINGYLRDNKSKNNISYIENHIQELNNIF